MARQATTNHPKGMADHTSNMVDVTKARPSLP